MTTYDVSITFDGTEEFFNTYQLASAAFYRVSELFELCEDDCFIVLQKARGIHNIVISVWVDEPESKYMSIMRHSISID